MNNLKSSICLLIALMFGFPFLNSQKELIIDKVIAKVGGEYVLYSELINNYKYESERNPGLEESAICGIMDQLIEQKLLINQAKLDSIEVSEVELESQLDFRMDRILTMMNGDEERFESYYGKSVLAMKEDMREDMRQQILANKIQMKLIENVTITPNEVIEFFKNIPKDSLPYLNSEVELGEIILHPQVNNVEREKALELITDIRNRIVEGGESFEDLAARYSQDGAAKSGGDLGWQKRGTFVTEFEAGAYGLKKEEISDIIETEFGFHLIKLTERRGNSIRVKHILIKPEITQEDLDLAKRTLDSFRQLILVDSLSFERAVKLYSDKKSVSYNNNGRMINPNNGSTYFETSELPFDVYFEIEPLEVNDVSKPIEYQTNKGTTAYRILKLLSKTKPHQANLQQDYTRIQVYAKESKKMIYYNDWMMQKLESTFIEVESDLGGCENLINWIQDIRP